MDFDHTIHALAQGLQTSDPGDWRRKAARIGWIKRTVAACLQAHREMTKRCCEAVDRMSDEEFERLVDEEQAKIDAIRAPLEAVAHEDRWPKHLYWGGI